MTNIEKFTTVLTRHYSELFDSDPDYGYSKGRLTPMALAKIMADGLRTGSANKDGKGIKRTCKELGIKYTYTEIKEFLK